MKVDSATISLSGVYSNIDTDALVTAAVAKDNQRVTSLTTQKTTQQSKETALEDIASSLGNIQSLMGEMKDSANLSSVSATSSDSSIVAVATRTGATAGTHKIVVNQLATSQIRIQTVGLDSGDSLVDAGGLARAFSYTYDSVTRTIQTAGDTTLNDLVGLINDDSSNPGVSASVLEYGGTYHLVLSARDTGAGNAITINDSATTLTGFDSADIAETQTAQDAEIRVDGFPSTTWLTRSSNIISDAIANVTITLENTGSVNISMSRNNSSVKTYLTSFVSAYNNLHDKMDKYTGYDSTTKQAGVLQGTNNVGDPLNKLRSSLLATLDGFKSGNDKYTVGSQIGLSLDKTGKLSLDTAVLDTALGENYKAVLAWIGSNGTGISDSDYIQFNSATDSTAGGTYDVKVSYDANENITQAVVRLSGSAIWYNLTIDGNTLSGKSGSGAEGLTMTVASDGTVGAHTQTAQVRVQRGFAAGNYGYLQTALDDTHGIYAIQEKEVQTTIENINNKIATLNDRIETKTTALKAKYARMEARLAQLEQQSEAVNSLSTTRDINKSNSA